MTDENEIIIDIEQGIMSIIFNRPEKKNALTNEMYRSINSALKQAEDDAQIRVVLFSGKGDCFTAGNDIKDFLRNDLAVIESEVAEMIMILASFEKPIVAAVHGNAIGIGTTMLLHCDLVVAARDTIFSMPFVPLGISPEAGSSLLLPKITGYQQAAEILLLGESFDVDKAFQLGMINRIVGTKEVKLQALALCQKLASLPTRALLVTKKLLKTSGDNVEQRILKEFKHLEKLLQTNEAKKIFKAFLAK